MIRLAARLTANAGGEGVVRLVLTAAGVALATAMLLFAAVAFPALRAHDVRRGWLDTSEQNRQPAQDEATTDPLLWRLTELRFEGRDLVRVDVAALGPDAPVPPGLDRLPAAGELAVSPELGHLLGTTPAAELAGRFPGEVAMTLGRDALVSPDQLVVVVGRGAEELAAEPEVRTVRSIEGAPYTRTLTRVMRLAVAIGGVGLLAPVIVFVATATRLAAARRERRLAALRLAGATSRQVGVLAAVDAVLAAVPGTLVGFGAFFALRPTLADLPLDGASFFPSDLRLPWTWAAAIGLGVPALAVLTAIVSLQRLRVSPLGVARRAATRRSSPRPLLLVVAGTGALVLIQGTMQQASDTVLALAVAAALLAVTLGIVWSGAWVTSVVGRGLGRVARRAPGLLAARRLQDDPAAGFRAIGGVALAVFVGTVFSSFTASALAHEPLVVGDRLGPSAVVAGLQPTVPEPVEDVGADRAPGPGGPPPVTWPVLEPSAEAALLSELAAVDGVARVVTARPLSLALTASDLRQAIQGPGLQAGAWVMACDDVRAIGLARCEGTTLVHVQGWSLEVPGVDLTDLVPLDELSSLPVVGVAAVTDGRPGAVEAARAVMERGLPASAALTQADFDARNRETARRTQHLSNLGMALTLVIAGCSLAVSVAGSIVERRQAFALLRLAGTRLSELRRIVLAEAAAPLLLAATVTVGVGLAVTALTLAADEQGPAFTLPGGVYWSALLGGLVLALAVVAATLPLLGRVTAPDTVRFE